MVQETFIRVYRNLGAYDGSKPFDPWFNRILYNECNRYLKKHARVVPSEISEERDLPSETDTYDFDRHGEVYEMVQRLDDQHRIPVILKYLNDVAEKDIADMMELNVNTVKSRLFKARKKLKEWMPQNREGISMGRDPWDQEITDGLKRVRMTRCDIKTRFGWRLRSGFIASKTGGLRNRRLPAPRESKGRRRSGRRTAGWIAATAAAATIVLTVSFQTAPVQAFLDHVKEWFAPQKTVEQELEGAPETSVDQPHEGADYVIYIDESRFKMIHESGVDRIELKEKPTDDRYPEVFMEISQEGVDPKTTAERIQTEPQEYPKVESNPVDEPIQGWEVRAVGGTGGKSGMTR